MLYDFIAKYYITYKQTACLRILNEAPLFFYYHLTKEIFKAQIVNSAISI